MSLHVDASELNRLAVDLGAAGPKVTSRASLVVQKSTIDMVAEAKVFCPVDTGNLQGSIGADFDPDGLGATAGPTANYGAYVEFGTSRMAPAAYMGPAFDRAQPGFLAALEQVAGDVL